MQKKDTIPKPTAAQVLPFQLRAVAPAPPKETPQRTEPDFKIPREPIMRGTDTLAPVIPDDEFRRSDLPDEPEMPPLPTIDDYMKNRVDLNRDLIKRPYSTFYIRFEGKARDGLRPGDILIVERGHWPEVGELMVALLPEESQLVIGRIASTREVGKGNEARLDIGLKIGKRSVIVASNDMWGCVLWTLHRLGGAS